jgi:hypothetical protein
LDATGGAIRDSTVLCFFACLLVVAKRVAADAIAAFFYLSVPAALFACKYGGF